MPKSQGQKAKDEKLRALREKKRQAAQVKADKASPPMEGRKFMARIDDLGPGNVSEMAGGVVSLQPWIGLCAVPLNIIPYRGCSNNCAYCFVNQMARGNIARKSGQRNRTFYGAVDNLKPLEELFQVSSGQRRLADLPQGRQLEGWFFERRIPARLSALTDPFMLLEKSRRKSHEILHLCQIYKYPVIINTKGGEVFESYFDLILSLPEKIVQVSLVSVDDQVAREYEPNAPPVSQRLAEIKQLTQAGVYVSVRMAPLIPDERIVGEEHLTRYARALHQAGVDFVEIKPLRAHRGVQTETENPSYRRVLAGLNTELFRGNQYSIPLDQLKEIGLRIRDCFGAEGVRYSSGHYLGRWSPFGDDVSSACHCADLEAVGGSFANYYKATFAQLGLEAKRLWDQYRCPVLIQRSDLDRYEYPPDNLIFPARSKAERLPYGALLDLWWAGIGNWFWLQPYFFQMGYEDAEEPALDYDAVYGLITYFYDPHSPVCRDTKTLEQRRQVYRERACVLLSGSTGSPCKVPFPEDQPDHPFWAARRKAYQLAQKGVYYPKERR